MDDVVAKGRRRNALRRFTVVGAAGGTAAAAAGIIVALMLASGSPTSNRAPHQPEPAASDSAASVADGTAPVRQGETSQQTSQRLAAALTRGLTAALPGVELGNGSMGQPGVGIYFNPNAPQYYDSDTVLSTANGRSEVFLTSWVGGRLGPTAPPATDDPAAVRQSNVATWFESCADYPKDPMTDRDGHSVVIECQDSTGPDGQKLVALNRRCTGCSGQPTQGYDVFVTWSNAKVEVAIERDLKRPSPNDPVTAQPLLSFQQVIAIAIDPDLTVTS